VTVTVTVTQKDSPIYRPVTGVDEIDLDRHGFIEASAGTGKTYTIEHLVLRLLMERPDLQLEEILLVTYTEKAAGELKARIRLKIETALAGEAIPPAQSRKLGAVLDAFDTAAIHTIHGFCHGVLSDYAFEHQMAFDVEVVDEAPVYRDQLREIMRRHWTARYGRDLQLLLHLAGFSGRETEFSAATCALAAHLYRPQLGDRLLPPTSAAATEDLLDKAHEGLKNLLAFLRPADDFLAGYAKLNFNAAARRKRMADIVAPLADLAGTDARSAAALEAFADWYLQVQKVESQGQKGIDAILPEKWNKSGANLEICPRLEKVVARLRSLCAIVQELQYRLQIETVHLLQQRVPRFKARKGWISYNDMLTRVADALTGAEGERLTAILRRRFKVAFVDEFQDTDPVQWRIFEHLFLDTESSAEAAETAGRLFLIGDPKQAIYAFRGADVFAYLNARQRMEILAAQGQAGLYCLATNWRSSTALVEAYNRLFGQEAWFPPPARCGPLDIGYQSVCAPPTEQIQLPLVADTTGRGALNLIDLQDEERPGRAKYRLAALIAAEIEHLVVGSRLVFGPPAERRRLEFGDIGILIRGRSEARLVERELQRRQIPYAYYKKPGLFQSEEARHLSLLLHALAAPHERGTLNAALLTPFFDLQPGELAGDPGLPDDHPLRRLLFKWHELAMVGAWSRLFDTLFSDSGVRFRQAADAQWDRIESNFSQLGLYLQQAAYEKNFDLRGLSAHLDLLILGDPPAATEADLHQIDTEAPKVQLMTMHVSKGLQFPVVFVAGGLTQPVRSGMTVYHRQTEPGEGGRIIKVIDLSADSGREDHLHEAREEDKRLLYVALTRARLKLYLPFYLPKTRSTWVGPASRILAPAAAACFHRETASEAVRWLSPSDILMAPAPAAGGGAADSANPTAAPRIDFPVQPSFETRRAPVASFTRLHKAAAELRPQATPLALFAGPFTRPRDECGDPAADEIHGGGAIHPSDGAPSATDRHPADRLPGGTRMGSLLHAILEQIDYQAVRRATATTALGDACRDLIRKLATRHQVDPVWLPDLAALVWNTLTTPVPCGEETLILGDLAPEARLHEPEFYCHLDGLPQSAALPSGGYLRGFVDLVFHHDGRYYILDWKSNRLPGGYDPDAVAASMQAAEYGLQYRIYTLAVLRWMRLRLGDRFDPRTHFGGVYYIYLRGMGRAPGSGVHYAAPDEIGDLAALEGELTRQLEACRGC
jgi:exodeoxyribonuclease V beta subunit